jgi:chromate transporter
VIAGVLFVLPGFLCILGLSVLYAMLQEVTLVAAMFFGLKAAVLAVVVEAVLRIGKRALKNRLMYGFAALAFVAIFFFAVPFPAVVVVAGLVGYVGSRVRPDAFPAPAAIKADGPHATVIDRMAEAGQLAHTRPSLPRALRVLVTCVALWAVPPLILLSVFGPDSVFVTQSVFFSQTAVVTFGGAYAVLAFIAQRAVDTYGWLQPGEMLDGLGLAETTPGPLIMVVQFVAFLGAFRNPGDLTPLQAGVLGSAITVWVTFVPCFLWIFLGAPYIEALRGHRALHAALSTITAAIVGVILNLSVWLGLHVVFQTVHEHHLGPVRLFTPELATLDPAATALTVVAMLAMFRFHIGLAKTLALSAVLGVAYRLLTAA